MSVRYLKAVAKGLSMLEVLNAHNGLTAMQLARQLRIPRSTAFRLLSNAVDAGFVQKDPTRMYRLTRAVRSLALHSDRSAAFAPIMQQFHEALGWPISIASLHGDVALLDATSDRICPQVEVREVAGRRVSLDTSALGLVIASQLDSKMTRALKLTQATQRACIKIRKAGYAATTATHGQSIAVPLRLKSCPAAIAVRFPPKTDMDELKIKQVVKTLVATASAIARALSRAKA